MVTDKNSVEKFEFGNGVTIQIWIPSSLALEAAMSQMNKLDPEPEVPKVWIEEKGREEQNPNDPDYLLERASWMGRISIRLFRALIATGTKIDYIPDNIAGPDSDEFAEFLETLGLDVPTNRMLLYVQWLQYYVATNEDNRKLSDMLVQKAGLREEDVAEIMATFPGLQGESANSVGTQGRRP